MTTIKFGTDGWRGVIADDFTYENVRKVACAIARYIARAEKPNAGILVGYDTRFGSERFARVAAEVVSMTGMPVWVLWKLGAAFDCRASGKGTRHGAGGRRSAAACSAC
ncbi:MAG: hypothetical protein ABSA96_03265 [Candidatus Acidiferrales bacterium]